MHNEIKEIKLKDFRDHFKLYAIHNPDRPAIERVSWHDGYRIRVLVKCRSHRKVKYDYFYTDNTGLIVRSPKKYSPIYTDRFRIVDIEKFYVNLDLGIKLAKRPKLIKISGLITEDKVQKFRYYSPSKNVSYDTRRILYLFKILTADKSNTIDIEFESQEHDHEYYKHHILCGNLVNLGGYFYKMLNYEKFIAKKAWFRGYVKPSIIRKDRFVTDQA